MLRMVPLPTLSRGEEQRHAADLVVLDDHAALEDDIDILERAHVA